MTNTWVILGFMSANKISLTTSKIKALTCEEGKSQSIYWDSKTPSLGVRITPTGNKAFIFQTWFNNTNLRVTIGDVNTWAIDKAQTEARRLKVLTDQGIDPREQRAEQKAEHTARNAKSELGLVVWKEYIKARKANWGERHLADHLDMVRLGGETIKRGLRKNQVAVKKVGILYSLLSKPLNELNREAVQAWIKSEVNVRAGRVRIALSALKAFITWMNDNPNYKGLVDAGTCDRLTRELPAKKAKDDSLQREQIKPWFNGVNKINNLTIRNYLQILLLTGARRNEIATMKWADVDLRWKTALIRDKVEGNRKIPITPYVELLLNQLPRKGVYVFHSSSEAGYLKEPRKAHQQVLKDEGLPQLSIHGLRRSFGTLAEWVECPAGISAQIMGHKPSAIAEKHYRARPIDLLRKWHAQIEKFILDDAGIPQPKEGEKLIRVVGD
jgi:integrase